MAKIGMTTQFYRDENGHTDFAQMRAHGFDCADYQALTDVHGILYTCTEGAFKEMLVRERAAAQAAGITVWQVHGPWYVDDATAALRAFNLNCMKRCAVGAHHLGSRYMVVHPVMPNHWDCETDSAWVYELNRNYFTELCDFAADYGVHICLENMPTTRHRIGTVAQVADFVWDVNRENFEICMDTGHANITGGKLAEEMRRCGSKLAVLHLHDNRGADDEHRFPFTGTFDWKTFRAVLRELHFDGVYSVESTFSAECPPLLRAQYLRALAAAASAVAAL